MGVTPIIYIHPPMYLDSFGDIDYNVAMRSSSNAGSDVISVYTSRSAKAILAEGGTQPWVLDRSRAAKCAYVVVCRNAKTRRAEEPEPDGTAFLVGKVKDVVASTEAKGRWLILFSEYAVLDVPRIWSGRNPVSYLKVGDFDRIDFERLHFKPLSTSPAGLTIAEAKAGLALGLNVPETAIEIIVRA